MLQVKVEKLVTAMGGVLQTKATLDVSFVIVKNVLAAKYKVYLLPKDCVFVGLNIKIVFLSMSRDTHTDTLSLLLCIHLQIPGCHRQ